MAYKNFVSGAYRNSFMTRWRLLYSGYIYESSSLKLGPGAPAQWNLLSLRRALVGGGGSPTYSLSQVFHNSLIVSQHVAVQSQDLN